jgi:membrane-associated phospholipid phosphatase
MFRVELLISLWQRLEDWDKWLFIKLNSQWTNPVFDTILPYFRDPIFWIPVYLFILVFIALNYGQKGIWWSLTFICTIALTDMIGSQVFKEIFQRTRPCGDIDFMDHVRLLLKQCGAGYSFVSNHAANHFGMASFAVFTFKGVFKKWIYLAYLWAFLIAYSQVYVGVHYPLDVICGGLLGVAMGSFTAWLFHKKWGSINPDNQLL